MNDAEILTAWKTGQLGECVEAALADLVGLPFQYMGRAGDIAWLGFGSLKHVVDPRGKAREVAEHSLHLQCPFRLAGPNGPITASSDMYHPRVDPTHEPEDFDWDVHGANWYDMRVADFFEQHANRQLLAEAVNADPYGGFGLSLTGGYTLEVFPATSYQTEHWRFLQHGGDHFVILPREAGNDEEG